MTKARLGVPGERHIARDQAPRADLNFRPDGPRYLVGRRRRQRDQAHNRSGDMRRGGDKLCYHVLLAKKPNCGCCSTRTIGGATCLFAILAFRLQLRFRLLEIGLLASVGRGGFVSGRLQLRERVAHAHLGRDVGDRYRGLVPVTPASTFASPARRRDRREAGVENNALRPFPVGMDPDDGDGRIGIRPHRDRQFRQISIRDKQQREQNSADNRKNIAPGAFPGRSIRANRADQSTNWGWRDWFLGLRSKT